MKPCVRTIISLLFFVPTVSSAIAQEAVVLDTYLCADFLKDVSKPADGASLLRSLMMISWATGYASAHQSQVPRADPKAVQLIAAALGAACRQVPEQKAVQAIVSVVNRLSSSETGRGNVSVPSADRASECQREFNAKVANGDLPTNADSAGYVQFCLNYRPPAR